MSLLLLLAATATAGGAPQTLTWTLSHEGASLGTRTLTVRFLGSESESNRVIEAFTELQGQIGETELAFRHRLTAHVDAREPAAFNSVVEDDGVQLEVQGRWTPSHWVVTTTARGRSRAVDRPLASVDFSTADLLDPWTRLPLAHFDEAKILSAVSGEVLAGPVERLGVRELTFGGKAIWASGYAWTSPEGRAEYYYSPDGFLVLFRVPMFGYQIVGTLRGRPPAGADDFAVKPSKRGAIEERPVR